MSVHSASEIGLVSQNLVAVEDWLRDHCEARNADSMADIVLAAINMLEDLYDEAVDSESAEKP